MIEYQTVRAFCSETAKLAQLEAIGPGAPLTYGGLARRAGTVLGDRAAAVGRGAGQLLREGWSGTAAAPMGWMGEGKRLWGATKHLPVGGKSLFMLGTIPQAAMALRREDPAGQGRTRVERVTGLAGNIAGGMLGAGLAMRTGLGARAPLAANLIGGMAGGLLGERVLASPFSHARKAEQQRLMQAYQQGGY